MAKTLSLMLVWLGKENKWAFRTRIGVYLPERFDSLHEAEEWLDWRDNVISGG